MGSSLREPGLWLEPIGFGIFEPRHSWSNGRLPVDEWHHRCCARKAWNWFPCAYPVFLFHKLPSEAGKRLLPSGNNNCLFLLICDFLDGVFGLEGQDSCLLKSEIHDKKKSSVCMYEQLPLAWQNSDISTLPTWRGTLSNYGLLVIWFVGDSSIALCVVSNAIGYANRWLQSLPAFSLHCVKHGFSTWKRFWLANSLHASGKDRWFQT